MIVDVDDMEDIIDDLLMRRKSGKYIAQTLASCGFGRAAEAKAPALEDAAAVISTGAGQAHVGIRARNELADLFTGHPVSFGAYPKKLMRGHAQEIAERVLAAGYRKPRTITTEEALDSLPAGSVVMGFDGDSDQIVSRKAADGLWEQAGTDNGWQAGGIIENYGPVTVLHEPAAPRG